MLPNAAVSSCLGLLSQCTDVALDRSAKQIQDKVFTILRQAKKDASDN